MAGFADAGDNHEALHARDDIHRLAEGVVDPLAKDAQGLSLRFDHLASHGDIVLR